MKFIEVVVETFKENKKLIIGLYILFLISFIVTWIVMVPKMAGISSNVTALNTTSVDSSAVELFIHNEFSGIITYVGSLLFGIIAIVMVIFNGYDLAMMGVLFARILPNGGIMYIIYLIPHGIFEITGMILDSTAGVLLFLFIWRFIKALRSNICNSVFGAFEKTKKILIQSMVIFFVASCLTLIAAPIEAHLSIRISEFLMYFFGLW